MKAKNKRIILKINPTALMFKNNQILYMRFQCTDVYGCPKLLDMCNCALFAKSNQRKYIISGHITETLIEAGTRLEN